MATKSRNTLKVTTPSDLEILMERAFDAPRELVFKALTDPQLIPKYWGGRKTTTIVDKMDVKPGGAWRFIIKEPTGEEYAFRGEYREVAPPERIVQTFEFEPWPGKISVETATLEEQDGKTTVRSTSVFKSLEDRDGMLNSGMESGAAELYDRLEELLETLV